MGFPVSVFKFPAGIMRRNFSMRQITFSVIAVIPAAVGYDFQDAVILIINAFWVVFFITRIPEQFFVFLFKVNNRFAVKAEALKGSIV